VRPDRHPDPQTNGHRHLRRHLRHDHCATTTARSRTTTDSGRITDVATATNGRVLAAADTVVAADSTTRTLTAPRGTTDSATVTDVATRATTRTRTTTDSATITDQCQRTTSTSRSTTDTASTADASTTRAAYAQTTLDTLTATATAQARVTLTRLLADSVTVVDALTATTPVHGPAIFLTLGPAVPRWTLMTGGPQMVTSIATVWQPLGKAKVIDAKKQPVDMAGAAAYAAFLASPSAEPAPGDWHDALCESTDKAGIWQISCIIGPGTPVELTEGVWWPWVRVNVGAENWPERCDSLTIT
jgi:hypothetical protein